MIDFTPVLQAIVGLCAAIITTFVVPYIKSKTTLEQQTQINEWIKIAVSAAEQVYDGPGQGDKKKAYVLTWLASHGTAIDADKVEEMIAAAVYELTNNGLIAVEGVTEEVQA